VNFSGKTIVVSGAAGAIGFDACRFVAARGAAVVCCDRTPLSESQRGVLAALTDSWHQVQCDVAKDDDAEAAVAAAIERFGVIDGVVNSAGLDRHHEFFELTAEEFAHMLDVNVLGSFRIAQAAARRMRQAPRTGSSSYSIVHLSSVNAVIGTASHTAYATSKGAIAQLTRVMAVALAPYGIRVNAVGPGTVRSTMLDDLVREKQRALEMIFQRTPIGRLAELEEVSSAIAFLLSDHASFITGQTLYVDGGRTVQNLTL
jgi:glucose 1-dehydrogenase